MQRRKSRDMGDDLACRQESDSAKENDRERQETQIRAQNRRKTKLFPGDNGDLNNTYITEQLVCVYVT